MANPPWLKHVTQFMQDNSTTILTGVAVTGVIGTVVLAIRGTPEALDNIAFAEEEKRMETPDITPDVYVTLTPLEIVKVAWRSYLPAALSGTATIACIIGANAIGLRRNAALAAAYTLVDAAFREYKDKVIETIGGKDEEKIRESIAEDRIKAKGPIDPLVIIGTGDVLCIDLWTGRLFKSDAESIRRAANDVDSQIFDDGWASLNVFYSYVGLDPVLAGEVVGWNRDHRPNLKLSSGLTECNVPALAIGWQSDPIREFDRF